MAMNKTERAEMERLRNYLALARAMRWPSYPKPAPMSLEQIRANLVFGGIKYGTAKQKVARGWFINSYLGGGFHQHQATYGCSDGNNHSTEGDVTTSQNRGEMYATKADALRALRIELTEKMAKVLANVDRQIEESE